jgi:hypothetical protein
VASVEMISARDEICGKRRSARHGHRESRAANIGASSR